MQFSGKNVGVLLCSMLFLALIGVNQTLAKDASSLDTLIKESKSSASSNENNKDETSKNLPEKLATNGVVLQGLDKTTARVFTLEVKLNEVVEFGTLRVRVRACYKNAPEETPESVAFVEIWEFKENETPKRLFSNWMFASSPAISSLEHPIYGVWIKECKDILPPSRD